MRKRSLKLLVGALAVIAALAAFDAFRISGGGRGARDEASAPPPTNPPTWPMPVGTFLKGDFLERGDVVLTRRNWDLASYIIRLATHSPFSHAALVFAKADQEPGITQSFVIESSTGGVDLTNLSDYINDKSSFVAIKRFSKPWFDAAMKARVRGLLLDKIKGTYDYWAVGRIAQSLWFGVEDSLTEDTPTETGRERTIKRYERRNWRPPNEFICSGLVQMGYVDTVMEYIRGGLLPPSSLSEVVFVKGTEKWLPDAAGWSELGASGVTVARQFLRQNAPALRSVTPEDLAQSDKLEWLYFIHNDMVYRVSSYDEVKQKLQ